VYTLQKQAATRNDIHFTGFCFAVATSYVVPPSVFSSADEVLFYLVLSFLEQKPMQQRIYICMYEFFGALLIWFSFDILETINILALFIYIKYMFVHYDERRRMNRISMDV